MKKFVSVVLALVLVSVLSVSAFAANSVVAPVEKDYDGGSIIYQPSADKDNEFTFVADPKDGYNFIGWEIEGDYEIVSGSLEESPITIIFKDGTTAEDVSPLFEKISDEKPDPTKKPKPSDDESPKTGKSVAMLALAVVACGGLIVSKKRLGK